MLCRQRQGPASWAAFLARLSPANGVYGRQASEDRATTHEARVRMCFQLCELQACAVYDRDIAAASQQDGDGRIVPDGSTKGYP
jgi:hypothetical protein